MDSDRFYASLHWRCCPICSNLWRGLHTDPCPRCDFAPQGGPVVRIGGSYGTHGRRRGGKGLLEKPWSGGDAA